VAYSRFIQHGGKDNTHLINYYMLSLSQSDMLDLVIEIHSSPDKFVNLLPGNKYGSWELVYSELLASCSKYQYNPCRDFPMQS